MDAQRKASDWIEDLCTVMNVAPVWSGFRLKIRPRAEASAVGHGAIYTSPSSAGPVAELDESDFIGSSSEPMIAVERKAQVDVPNLLQFQHPNRDSDYNHVVTAQPEQSTIALFGVRKDAPKLMPYFQSAAIARLVLGVESRRRNYLRNTYKFKLNAKWKLLEPMDLVTITDPQVGIFGVPVRLTKVVEDADYNLDCEAEPFVYGASSPNLAQAVATTPDQHTPQTDQSPASINAPIIFEPPVRLSNQQRQLWFVVSDADAEYGGCVVFISTDGGVSYNPLGTISGSAITGETVGAWPAHADPDNTNDLALDLSESLGELTSYQVADEDNFVYPCYVAGGTATVPYELMTYAVAQLTSAYHYTLKATGDSNKLRRAVFAAPTVGEGVLHASGSRFAFLSPSGVGMLKVPLDPSWVGKTLYFKFPAFNHYGSCLQSLAGLTAYRYTPLDTGVGTNPNNASYTVDPCPCLSQPAGTFHVELAAATAHFPTNDAKYNARTFTVSDPGGNSSPIPAGSNANITNVSRSGGLATLTLDASMSVVAGNTIYASCLLGAACVFVVNADNPTSLIVSWPGADVSSTPDGGVAYRGIVRLVGMPSNMVMVIDAANIGATAGAQITISGVDDASFDGTYTVAAVLPHASSGSPGAIEFMQAGSAPVVSGHGTIALVGGGNTQVYHVTIYDPGFVGDAQGACPAYCETSQDKVGVPGYAYMGSIYVTHAGGDVLLTCGGWPQQQTYLVNGE